ncbi:PQQ-like beta-propeller repeat protein, partial [bacterium]|nr:PQQ-like beta-propeller repeat protein [bacterium]
GAPILNSVAASDSKVFFGAMDGSVYALDVSSGVLIWKSQLSWRLGFSTAPVIADSKIMLGGRNGIFYALDLEDGSTIWEYDVGFPILQTAAWSNGMVIFGAMDMHVYALDSHIGSLVWQSEKIPGVAFKDYWPVVYNGYVFISPMTNRGFNPGIKPNFPFSWFESVSDWNWLMEYGPIISDGRFTDVSDAMIAQDNAISNYHSNPSNFTKTLFILDENTGEEAFVVPHWSIQTMNGAISPPCIDRDGKLIVPVLFGRSGWGRLDLSSQRIIDILYDHLDREGGTMNAGDTPAGMGNADESLNVTCTGNSVLTIHTQEFNAAYTGVFNLDSRTWYRIRPGHTNLQMSTNTQGGAGNPASV